MSEHIDTDPVRAAYANDPIVLSLLDEIEHRRCKHRDLATEVDRLRALLRLANEAFDECTGDYPKELVLGEPWREYRDKSDERPHLSVVSPEVS